MRRRVITAGGPCGLVILLTALVSCAIGNRAARAADAASDHPWVTFEGKGGPGKGKQIVLVSGDDEYRSEEELPRLARILADHHGFTCTVVFPINRQTGVIDIGTKDNIPGLEALDHADLMIIAARFRQLPDDQMKHIVDFINSGKGVIGLRTATHSFKYEKSPEPSAYAKYSYNSHDGGFGRQVLGETWINHWGHHGKQSTRGLIAPGAEGDPILRGIKSGDIWCVTDVYEVKLPMQPGIKPLIMGQVLEGMNPTDPPAGPAEDPKIHKTVDKNNPMMPVAWTRTYTSPDGKAARVFCTTMAGDMSGKRDIDNEPLRRLLVNATYWTVGLEEKITDHADVDFVGENGFKRGVRPQDVKP